MIQVELFLVTSQTDHGDVLHNCSSSLTSTHDNKCLIQVRLNEKKFDGDGDCDDGDEIVQHDSFIKHSDSNYAILTTDTDISHYIHNHNNQHSSVGENQSGDEHHSHDDDDTIGACNTNTVTDVTTTVREDEDGDDDEEGKTEDDKSNHGSLGQRMISFLHRYRPPLNITHAFRNSKNDNLFSFGKEATLRDVSFRGHVYLSRKNKLRRIFKALAFNQFTQYLLVLCSILSVILIAVEPPSHFIDRWKHRNPALIVLDTFCVVVFTLDIIFRMIALLPFYFFVYDFPYNIIDLVVTVTSWIPIVGPASWMIHPMLRLFTRGIRPLKLFKNLYSFRIIVMIGKKGARQLINLLILTFFVMWVFALIGLLSFSGSLQRRCVVKETGEISYPELFCKADNPSMKELRFMCPDNQICVNIHENPNDGVTNFNNIFSSLFSVFQTTTLEGWSDIFYAARSSELSYLADFYFVGLIVVIAFLILQLFLASIANLFDEVSSTSSFLNTNYEAKQFTIFGYKLTLQRSKEFLATHSAHIRTNSRLSLLNIFEHRLYNAVISLIIICNITILCLNYYSLAPRFKLAIFICEIIFTSFYCVEAFLKIISYRPITYFSYNIFRFEFALSVITLIGLIFQRVVLLQCFRFMRLFRCLRSFKPFVKMMSDVFQRPVALFNLLVLLMYTIFSYSIIGMALFGGEFPDDADYNFNTFPKAFISTFQLCTVENWTDALLLGLKTKTRWMAPIFTISFLAFSQYIILNCFIALILQNFSLSDEEKVELEKDVLNKMRQKSFYRPPKHFLERVKLLWGKMSPKKLFTGTSMIDRKQDLRRKRASIINSIEISDGISWITVVGSQSDLAKAAEEERSNWKTKLLYFFQNYSLFLFSPENSIRQAAQFITTSQFFHLFIYLMISVSSIFLVVDSPLSKAHSMSFNLDIFFNVLFTIEFLLKVVSTGFIFTDTAYIFKRDNFIDFLALVLTWVGIVVGPEQSMRLLRVFRFIRPLQLLTKSNSNTIKQIINAFAASMSSLVKLVIVWLVFMVIFGASGMLLFQGKLYSCNDSSVQYKKDCTGLYLNDLGIWVPRKYSKPALNFDDLLTSITTLFTVSSTEGWLTVLHNTMGFTNYDQQPEPWNRPYYAIFFIIFITLFTFFLFDVSVGVIVEKTREVRGDSLLTSKQKVYRNLEVIVSDMKAPTKKKVPEAFLPRVVFNTFGGFRKRSRRSHLFNIFMACVIVVHSLLLSTQFYGQPKGYTIAIMVLNAVFNFIYLIEVVLKLMAISTERFFRKKAHVYEFVVMVLGIMSSIVEFASLISHSSVSPMLVYLARLVVVLRMLRLIKFFAFTIITKILIASMPYLASLCAVMFVFLLLFAIIGVDMCGRTKFGFALNSNANFQNTYNAIMLLFRVTTGENWPLLMQDCSIKYPQCDPSIDSCGSYLSPLYFICFQVIGANIVLNFMIAGIIDSFEWITTKESSFLGSNGVIRKYNSVWKKFDTLDHCRGKIPLFRLKDFLISLGNPLGIATISVSDIQSTSGQNGSSNNTTSATISISNKLSKEARMKYRMIRYEAERHSELYYMTPGLQVPFIDYNKLLLILLRHLINIQGLNYLERKRRQRELDDIRQQVNQDVVKAFLLMAYHRRLYRKGQYHPAQQEEQQTDSIKDKQHTMTEETDSEVQREDINETEESEELEQQQQDDTGTFIRNKPYEEQELLVFTDIISDEIPVHTIEFTPLSPGNTTSSPVSPFDDSGDDDDAMIFE